MRPLQNSNAAMGTSIQHSLSDRALGSSMAPRQVPIGIDLNEFMLDTDLDFFSRDFDVGPQY